METVIFFHYCRPITLNFIIKETSIIVRNRMRVKIKKHCLIYSGIDVNSFDFLQSLVCRLN